MAIIHPTLIQGLRGAGAYPWTTPQSVAGLTHRERHPFTFTPTVYLGLLIYQTLCLSLDFERNPERTLAGEKPHRKNSD